MTELFENIERTFNGPSEFNENPYHYYNRSSRNSIDIIRKELNIWFRNYPENEKVELKNRFIKNFYSSFYELFLYQLFISLGFKVTIHPELSNTTKRPDFLISKDDTEIYVEAKILKDKSNKQESLERKENELLDNLNKIKNSYFILSLREYIFKNEKQPSTKPIIKYIEEELKKLDPDKTSKEIEFYGYESCPIIYYEDEDIKIEVNAIPLSANSRGKEMRPIGVYPFEPNNGGAKSIKDAINSKAIRYGKLEKPFIVCVNILNSISYETLDIENAIWGSLLYSWSENRNEKYFREYDSIFLVKNGPRLKNLSGVLLTKVFPHNIPSSEYWLFKHPFSDNVLDFNKIGLTYSFIENKHIKQCLGQDFDEILLLNKDWLTND